MKKHCFTLLEFLVVIAIIIILIGLLLPVIQSVRNQAKKTQAKAQMNAIITAIKTYESTFGVLPLPNGWVEYDAPTGPPPWPWPGFYYRKYDDLMALLTDVAAPQTEAAYTSGNSRNVRFLDVPTNYTTKSFLDPWGSRYLIHVDSGYTGSVVVNPGSENEILYGTVFIYSTAGTNISSEYVYSWK